MRIIPVVSRDHDSKSKHKYYCPGVDGEGDGLLLPIEEVAGGPKILLQRVHAGEQAWP